MRIPRYAAAIALAMMQPALGQAAKPVQTAKIETREYKHATFSGNETRLQNIYHVRSDCTSGPEPEARLVTTPKNGAVEIQQRQVPISYRKESMLAHCNGKPVNALTILYTSKEDFVGTDRVVIDVNYRDGVVIRYVYVLQVR